jgi:uncharacterized protein (TIGR00369 family)
MTKSEPPGVPVTTSPMARALGMVDLSVDADIVVMVPFRDDLVGDPDMGVIAGGVVTTLLDHTSARAVAAALTEETSIATLDLRIDYMRPARPGSDIMATAYCYKITRSVAFVRALAYDADPSDPVASAQGTFMLNSNAGRGAGANLQPVQRKPRARA